MSAPPPGRIVGTTRGRAGRPPTPVHSYELRSDVLRVEVWDHGARLVAVEAPDRDGRTANVVLRHPDLATYDGPAARHAYFGATVGRVANRIARSRFVLDGVEHVLDANEGRHHVHGGPVGFDQHVWTLDPASPPTPASISLRLRSPDGDQGYPGTVELVTTYTLDHATLVVETAATTDAPTVVGVTNHAYWNLAGGGPVDGHRLRVDASRYVPVDDELIPSGPLAPVTSSLDFRAARSLAGTVAAGGVDRCLVLDDDAVARLADPASGRALTLTTDQPGLQLFVGTDVPHPSGGVCLEPQPLPDTPNRPDFGSIVLRPGECSRTRTAWVFAADEPPG